MPYYRWNFAGDHVAEKKFDEWLKSDSEIVSFSFGKGIIVLFENGTWGLVGITKHLDNKLRGRQATLPRPTYVTTDAGNRYYIEFCDGERKWKASRSFSRAVNYASSSVSNIAFAPRNGWYILFQDGTSAWNRLPKSLHQLLKQRKKQSKNVKSVSVSPDGDWFVSYCDGTWDSHLPPSCQRAFDSLFQECSPRIDHVALGKQDVYCIVYDIHSQFFTLSPLQISFSKSYVSAHFDDNQSLWSVIRNLEKNTLDPSTFPPIRVVRKDDKWISLDNRRLFVFQNASISSISVNMLNQSFEVTDSYRSVKVKSCSCKECDFAKYKEKSTERNRKSCNDAWARSWSWRLFMEEETPPSAFLLANSLILPSIRNSEYLGNISSSKLQKSISTMADERNTSGILKKHLFCYPYSSSLEDEMSKAISERGNVSSNESVTKFDPSSKGCHFLSNRHLKSISITCANDEVSTRPYVLPKKLLNFLPSDSWNVYEANVRELQSRLMRTLIGEKISHMSSNCVPSAL